MMAWPHPMSRCSRTRAGCRTGVWTSPISSMCGGATGSSRNPMACIDWLAKTPIQRDAESLAPNVWLLDLLWEQETKPDGFRTEIELAVETFIAWYRAARMAQPGPIIYQQDLSGSLDHALSNRQAMGPNMRADELRALTQRIDPLLARELRAELRVLGFQLEP